MPGLDFATCPRCSERHALWRGAMSIHTTAAGDRCAPAVIPARPAAVRATRSSDSWGKPKGGEYDPDPEVQAAHAAGRARTARKRDPVEPEKQLTRAERKRRYDAMTPMERARHDIKQMNDAERAIAAKKRKNPFYGIKPASPPLDRGIYHVKGAYPVRGGLPTLSKRAR